MHKTILKLAFLFFVPTLNFANVSNVQPRHFDPYGLSFKEILEAEGITSAKVYREYGSTITRPRIHELEKTLKSNISLSNKIQFALATDGIDFEVGGETFTFFVGWGKHKKTLGSDTPFFKEVEKAIDELEEKYRKEKHLEGVAKNVSDYDRNFPENSGYVFARSKKDGKLALFIRLTQFNRYDMLEAKLRAGLSPKKDQVNASLKYGQWANLFMTTNSNVIYLPHVHHRSSYEELQYNKKMSTLMPKAEKLYADLKNEVLKLINHRGVGDDIYRTSFHGFFNHIPRPPFLKTTEEISYDLRHDQLFSFRNWKIAQEQIMTCANVFGFPSAIKLKEIWVELYPPKWFNAFEMGRLWFNNNKLRLAAWPLYFSGLMWLTRYEDFNHQIYSEVVANSNEEEPFLNKILSSIGFSQFDVSELDHGGTGYMHRNALYWMRYHQFMYLGGFMPWKIIKDASLKNPTSDDFRNYNLREVIEENIKFLDPDFTFIPPGPKRIDIKKATNKLYRNMGKSAVNPTVRWWKYMLRED